MSRNEPVTELLAAWRAGSSSALDEVTSLIYSQLHEIAARHVRRERRDHTLQATALINEAFIALVSSDVQWNDRVHFFAVASNVMRRILIDHARAAGRKKRGGDALHVTLHESAAIDKNDALSLLDLDTAISKLEAESQRSATIVEMHYFGGLSYQEIADVIDVSAATVKRELRFSKAWMRRELSENEEGNKSGR